MARPEHNPLKLECAKIFRRRLDEVLADLVYATRLNEYRELYEAE